MNTANHALLSDIAAAIGDGWTSVPDAEMRMAHLAHTDGRRVFATFGGWQNDGRIRFSAALPDGWRDDVPYDMRTSDWKITVKDDTPGDKIARAIKSRLLDKSGYDRDFLIVRARREASRKRDDVYGRKLREIVESFGLDIDDFDPSRNGRDGFTDLHYRGDVRAEINMMHPNDDGSFPYGVDFKIHVPVDMAETVGRFVRMLRTK